MNQKELKKIYDSYSNSVYRFLIYLSKSKDIAFDLMQDTFIKANKYYKAGNIRNEENWLIKTAHNLFLDYIKSQKKESQVLNTISEKGNPAKNPQYIENAYIEEIDWKTLRQNILIKLNNENEILIIQKYGGEFAKKLSSLI